MLWCGLRWGFFHRWWPSSSYVAAAYCIKCAIFSPIESKFFNQPFIISTISPFRRQWAWHQYHRNGSGSWPGSGKAWHFCENHHRARSSWERWTVSYSNYPVPFFLLNPTLTFCHKSNFCVLVAHCTIMVFNVMWHEFLLPQKTNNQIYL